MDKDIKDFIVDFMNKHKDTKALTDMSFDDLADLLIKEGMYKDKESIKFFLIDMGLTLLSQGEFDLPIGYYAEEEKHEGIVTTGDEALTDDYVKNNFKVIEGGKLD